MKNPHFVSDTIVATRRYFTTGSLIKRNNWLGRGAYTECAHLVLKSKKLIGLRN